MDDRVARMLAGLPAVHVLVDAAVAAGAEHPAPRWAVVEAARRAIANQRKLILARSFHVEGSSAGRPDANEDLRATGADVSTADAEREPVRAHVIAGEGAHVGAAPVATGVEAANESVGEGAHAGAAAAANGSEAANVSVGEGARAGAAPVASGVEAASSSVGEGAHVGAAATVAGGEAAKSSVGEGAHLGAAPVATGGEAANARVGNGAHVGAAPAASGRDTADASDGGSAPVGAAVGKVDTTRDAARLHASAGTHVTAPVTKHGRASAAHASAGADADTSTLAAIDPRDVAAAAVLLARSPLRRVINATGVVLHTNLGRAPLAEAARRAIDEVAAGYSNLEYDLERGARGSRHDHLREMLRELTGAEDAIVVNNNAAATVLGLAALATEREIIVSRGELIEIGGSFRLPEILALSRGVLVEVGTTNKTHRRDYEAAIRPATGLLLKVHRSNFAIVGFTSEVAADEIVAIGRAAGVASMIDLGSGAVVDRATQRRWGLPDEPTVAETVAAGADLVTFSGDKLLGGPQAGIVVGRAAAVERARKHPLMRALRPDKLTLAGLAATLALYRDGQLEAIPTTRMLGASAVQVHAAAVVLAGAIGALAGITVAVEACSSTVGGGAMPTAQLASWAVTLRGRSADALDVGLRRAEVPVVGRIEDGRVWLDVRTIAASEMADVVATVRALAG